MNNEKIKFYSPISEEMGVVQVFSKIHEKIGFKKIVQSCSRGFDIDDIEYIDDIGIHRVTVEFEYLSSNFLLHAHQDNMLSDRKYIVICWEDDCNLAKLLLEKYNKMLYRVIELKKYVEIVPDLISDNSIVDKKYYLINYNPDYAENRSFSDWSKSNMYRFNNGNNINVIPGSKALVKQGEYIVGGFDIVRFNNINLSDNDDLINLYKTLTDYPVSLFVAKTSDIKEEYVEKNIGHIFYNNFEEIGNKNLRRTIKEILPELNISYGAIQYLTKEQFDKLSGEEI